jgi:acyl-CoA thioester hydrolase
VPYVDFRHRLPLRVRWAEVDLQGVVFNGHYLTYCDVCVTEYWRAIGMTYPAAFLAVGSIFCTQGHARDHAPARCRRRTEICGRTARLGTTSLLFKSRCTARADRNAAYCRRTRLRQHGCGEQVTARAA